MKPAKKKPVRGRDWHAWAFKSKDLGGLCFFAESFPDRKSVV